LDLEDLNDSPHSTKVLVDKITMVKLIWAMAQFNSKEPEAKGILLHG
jgi:hypothetical protein